MRTGRTFDNTGQVECPVYAKPTGHSMFQCKAQEKGKQGAMTRHMTMHACACHGAHNTSMLQAHRSTLMANCIHTKLSSTVSVLSDNLLQPAVRLLPVFPTWRRWGFDLNFLWSDILPYGPRPYWVPFSAFTAMCTHSPNKNIRVLLD